MRLSIGHKLTVAYLAAAAILLATAIVSYRNTRELLRASEGITHAQQVLHTIEGVLASTLDAESGVRAYAMQGEERSRRQVQSALTTTGRRAASLVTLIGKDDALFTERVAFSHAVTRRLAQFRETMAARDSGGEVVATASLARADRSATNASLHTSAERLLTHERAHLATRTGIVQVNADRGGFILRLSLLLVAILAPLTFLIMRNDHVIRREAERAVAESEARFRASVDGSMDAFYVLRAVRDGRGDVMDFEFVDVNARTETLLGHSRETLVGQRLCELIPANRSLGFQEKYRRVMESRVPLEEEVEVAAGGIHAAWIHHQVVPLADGVAITSRDITDRKRQEEALRAMSLVDELTGLYNRRGFLTLAQQQLKLARRGHREVLLLFIDMDDFKDINDTFGHAAGDGALVRAAEILRDTFRDSDILARMGGDEFVVLATDAGSAGSEIIINRLCRALHQRNERDGFAYRLSFSVGAARFDPESPPSIEELLTAADAMLYEQKKHKRQLSSA